MTHHSEEECTSSDNVGSLASLLRRVVVVATVMEKAHEKPAFTLVDLI